MSPELSPLELARVLRAAAAEAERIAAERIAAGPQGSAMGDALLPLADCGDVPVRTLRAAIAAGALPAAKIGREYRVRRSDLDAWLDARRVTPRPQTQAAPSLSSAERAIARAQRTGALRLL